MDYGDKLQEKCAVFGTSLTIAEAAGITYNGLLSLQHRGQEGAGIAVVDGKKIRCHKDIGLVSEVFSAATLSHLATAKTAVGHTRYSTTGSNVKENVGPFLTEYLTGRLATAHNGNITNAAILRQQLEGYGLEFQATSDSEVISALIAYEITQQQQHAAIPGIIAAARQLEGAFALVIATSDNLLVAVRDPYGYRPLCIGKNNTGMAIASESCALDACGFEFIRDVAPGEVIAIQDGRIIGQEIPLSAGVAKGGLCIFEYVYFSRPDSVIDGLSVYQARYRMGEILAEQQPVAADIVCGVPDSGLEAAQGYSARSGIPLASGFVKNPYVGRSFIYPSQTERDSAVRLKLNPLTATIAGKRIVLVDDSIVRGTTSEKIVRSLKQAGAAEVHVRISSPPFINTCHYGTDIDTTNNLIARKFSIDDICVKIGADSLGYISLAGLKTACNNCRLDFCTACFRHFDDHVKTGQKYIFE